MIKVLRSLLLISLTGNCVNDQRLLADATAGVPTSPDVPPVTAGTSPAVPTIIPNGIVALFGEPQVLFKVLTAAPSGQAAAPEQSYLLSVGDQRAGIEVQQIDAQAGIITFNNHGLIQKLTLLTGMAWSSAQGSREAGLAANHPQTPNPHRLVRQMNVAEDPRRHVAPDADQAGSEDAASSFSPLPTGGAAEALPQPLDNSQKLAIPEAAGSSSSTPAQLAGLEAPATSGSDDPSTAAEVLAQQLIAGGDVPPPPPVTGN
jgi:hypothetical protein